RRAVDATDGPRIERVFADGEAGRLEPPRQLLDGDLAIDQEVRALGIRVASRTVLGPGAKAEGLDALLEEILRHGRRQWRRIGHIGIARADAHRNAGIAAGADQFDA